jgi:uncharacterized damage-inducible protein DinB
VNTILRDLIEHHVWANDALLAYCEGLTPGQLSLTAPGTFGGVEATLVHIALNEEHYLRLIDRGGVPTGITTTILDGDVPRAVASVRPVLERTAAAWRAVVDRHPDNRLLELEWEGKTERLPLSVIVTQVVEHGAEHRTHIRTILATHGVAAADDDGTTEPDLSAWAWEDARASAS